MILGILLVVLIIVKLIIRKCIDDDGLMSNLISEVVGAIVTFTVIDGILRYMDQQEKLRLQKVAIRSLRQPLRRYIWAWIHVSTNEENARRELGEIRLSDYLVSDNFIRRITIRSFNDPFTVTPLLGPDRPLRIKFPEIVEGFQRDLKEILQTYSYALDADLISLLQHFSDDAHLYNPDQFNKGINFLANA